MLQVHVKGIPCSTCLGVAAKGFLSQDASFVLNNSFAMVDSTLQILQAFFLPFPCALLQIAGINVLKIEDNGNLIDP